MIEGQLRGSNNEGQVVQGFAPEPTKSLLFTIGTSTAIDVSAWLAVRWHAQDDAALVCRKLNNNTVGVTMVGDTDVIHSDVASITFTGTAGTVIEIEGM